jgi:hypothetical protein
MSLVLDSVPAVRASDCQDKEHHVGLRDNQHGPGSPGGRTDMPHWLRAPRDRSESKSVRGMRRVGLLRGESSGQRVGEDVLACEEVFLDESLDATKDMMAEVGI